MSDWSRSTQIAAGLALLVLVLLVVLDSWRDNAELWRTHASELEAEQGSAIDKVEDLTRNLAASERALEQAREAAEVAEEEAQEAAESELEERIAEVDAELEAAREELAAASAALDEREAELTQAEETQARSTFGDGVHLVGEDIEPGAYRREEAGRCYWARLSGLGGELSDVIANDITEGPATVQIEASDVAFESSRCGQWTRR